MAMSPAELEIAPRLLSQALPYMRRYAGATFVVKYGGNAMGDPALADLWARDMVLLKQVGIDPVVVHGGGPQIARMLGRLGIESSFVDGLRVTDQATMEVVEMVLAGSINKEVVTTINRVGGRAIGLCGKDANLIRARKLRLAKRDPDGAGEQVPDLGFVGEPVGVDAELLSDLSADGVIPVVAPIGVGQDGETYNINADTVAGAVAGALGAARFLLLTDVEGVLDGAGELIPDMTRPRAEALIADGTISGGMIPKIETCLEAVRQGVDASTILDGRKPHAVLLEIFTESGAGTLIRPE